MADKKAKGFLAVLLANARAEGAAGEREAAAAIVADRADALMLDSMRLELADPSPWGADDAVKMNTFARGELVAAQTSIRARDAKEASGG